MKNQAALFVAFLASATTSVPSSPSKGMAAVMHSKRFLELGKGQCVVQGTLERVKERYVCVCFHRTPRVCFFLLLPRLAYLLMRRYARRMLLSFWVVSE